MQQLGIDAVADRPAVNAAVGKAELTGAPAVAIELNDGRIVTGKTSPLLGASSAALLNALKAIAGIKKEEELISPEILAPIQVLKTKNLGGHNPRLHTDEVLMSLTISALSNPVANAAKEQLSNLHGSNAHFSVIISEEDEKILRRLGINVSCEAKYENKSLYHK